MLTAKYDTFPSYFYQLNDEMHVFAYQMTIFKMSDAISRHTRVNVQPSSVIDVHVTENIARFVQKEGKWVECWCSHLIGKALNQPYNENVIYRRLLIVLLLNLWNIITMWHSKLFIFFLKHVHIYIYVIWYVKNALGWTNMNQYDCNNQLDVWTTRRRLKDLVTIPHIHPSHHVYPKVMVLVVPCQSASPSLILGHSKLWHQSD